MKCCNTRRQGSEGSLVALVVSGSRTHDRSTGIATGQQRPGEMPRHGPGGRHSNCRTASGPGGRCTIASPNTRRGRAQPVMVKMNQTPTLDPVHCAGCELEVVWPPIERDGQVYCCDGCAVGGPCCCSYDEVPIQAHQRKLSLE